MMYESIIQTEILDRDLKARTERVLKGLELFPSEYGTIWTIGTVTMEDDPDFIFILEVHNNQPCPWAKIVLTYKGTEVYHWSNTNSFFGCYGTTLWKNHLWGLERDLRIRLDIV